ncbi:MAG: hypothetical protein IJ112_00130 [Oscillospiraceae bacterium]|nr:hypothetical protein [Oscillospiraceae bacterium]
MKHWRKLLAVTLVLVLALGCLTACGRSLSDEESAAVGKYELISYSASGVDVPAGDGYLDLQSNGKAELIAEGEGGTVKWSLEDGTLTINDAGTTYSGTLDGGEIRLEMGGIVFLFRLEG